MKEKTFSQGVRAAIPTALGYISIGLACGIIAAPYLNPVEMGLMSFLVYAGSAQFVMLSLIAVQASIADIALTVFFINLRFFLLSLHTSTFFRSSSLWQNLAIGSLLTDESYGVLLTEQIKDDTVSASWMQGNNLMSYLSWTLATILGAALGSFLPNPEPLGLDFALLGMFIGIFAAQFLVMLHKVKLQKLLLILLVVGLAFLALTSLLSQSLAVLLATLIGCTVGVVLDD
ncbi:AzlC family ABC transporter permease [Streptococcus oricebi]|uniref:Branched-chain amino acid transporter AzlC n=1 Tax=Streptococcus oricebi TaxID=1547447 RepID=A0ABS5B6Y0_9STRE|nr:AzlC family ABC transporter permease [Streptococcus oricebi]MBP2623764.1 branched-chain amino acid transporter AzlC [Streptococcus oricebi]